MQPKEDLLGIVVPGRILLNLFDGYISVATARSFLNSFSLVGLARGMPFSYSLSFNDFFCFSLTPFRSCASTCPLSLIATAGFVGDTSKNSCFCFFADFFETSASLLLRSPGRATRSGMNWSKVFLSVWIRVSGIFALVLSGSWCLLVMRSE